MVLGDPYLIEPGLVSGHRSGHGGVQHRAVVLAGVLRRQQERAESHRSTSR